MTTLTLKLDQNGSRFYAPSNIAFLGETVALEFRQDDLDINAAVVFDVFDCRSLHCAASTPFIRGLDGVWRATIEFFSPRLYAHFATRGADERLDTFTGQLRLQGSKNVLGSGSLCIQNNPEAILAGGRPVSWPVKSVNNVPANVDGNVPLTAKDVAGAVRMVNGVFPKEDGGVQLTADMLDTEITEESVKEPLKKFPPVEGQGSPSTVGDFLKLLIRLCKTRFSSIIKSFNVVEKQLKKKADLGENGKVLPEQLPTPAVGLQLGTTSTTAHRGDQGNTAYTHSQNTTGNPHNLDGTKLNSTVSTTGLPNPVYFSYFPRTQTISQWLAEIVQAIFNIEQRIHVMNKYTGYMGSTGAQSETWYMTGSSHFFEQFASGVTSVTLTFESDREATDTRLYEKSVILKTAAGAMSSIPLTIKAGNGVTLQFDSGTPPTSIPAGGVATLAMRVRCIGKRMWIEVKTIS